MLHLSYKYCDTYTSPMWDKSYLQLLLIFTSHCNTAPQVGTKKCPTCQAVGKYTTRHFLSYHICKLTINSYKQKKKKFHHPIFP